MPRRPLNLASIRERADASSRAKWHKLLARPWGSWTGSGSGSGGRKTRPRPRRRAVSRSRLRRRAASASPSAKRRQTPRRRAHATSLGPRATAAPENPGPSALGGVPGAARSASGPRGPAKKGSDRDLPRSFAVSSVAVAPGGEWQGSHHGRLTQPSGPTGRAVTAQGHPRVEPTSPTYTGQCAHDLRRSADRRAARGCCLRQ
jgi:hypothetical protein